VDAVREALREEDSVSGAALAVEPGREEEVREALRATPRVAGVTLKSAVLARLRELLAENLLRMRAIDLAFALILAAGVVFNAARVSFSEHARELASLRVLGFTRAETAWVLVGEQAALALAAVPLGLVLGRLLAEGVVQGLETETQSFPAVVFPSTYGMAAVVTLAAVAASAVSLRRRLANMDLVEVLKTRE
jgi:putative ABC transport system permease protein